MNVAGDGAATSGRHAGDPGKPVGANQVRASTRHCRGGLVVDLRRRVFIRGRRLIVDGHADELVGNDPSDDDHPGAKP